jgi:hypothetical protein
VTKNEPDSVMILSPSSVIIFSEPGGIKIILSDLLSVKGLSTNGLSINFDRKLFFIK